MDEQALQQRAAFDIVESIGIDNREIRTLNSLSVVAKVVRWRKEPRTLTRRLIDAATGRNRQFDTLFEGQASDALQGLYDILADVRRVHAESDLIIAKTANKVVQLHGALKEFKGEVVDMIAEMRADITELQFRVEGLEARGAIDDAILRLRDPELGPLTLDRLWLEIDGLWWSDFGTAVRRDPKAKSTQNLVEKLQREMASVLRDSYRPLIEANFALPVQTLLDGVPKIEPSDAEVRELVALDPSIELRPLTMAVLTRSLGREANPKEERMVPRVSTASGIAERLLNETRRSTGE